MNDNIRTSRQALVRPPSPRLADGLVTHIERSNDVDPDRALHQWESYVAVLQGAGWTTRQVAAAPDCPDGVFIEDTMVVAGELAVMSAPGAPEREAEVDSARTAATDIGLRVVELADAPVQAPVALDGGDVLQIGQTVYVGLGGRTNKAGAAALAHYFSQIGRRVVPVHINATLHLKSQVTALPDGTVVGYRPLTDDPDFWPGFLNVPEPEGAHVIVIGPNAVLMSDQAPRSAELLNRRGLQVITVAIDEFAKLEGCVTCLSVRLHDAD
jgi:dimethylargininase